MRTRSGKSATADPTKVVDELRNKLLLAEVQLNGVFIRRKEVVRVMIIAHLVRQHYLLVGTPGTAKTAIATSFSKHITGASYFKTMLGSFTTPAKVFGPLNVKAFTEDGEYVTVIDGKLADVVHAFLDEFMKAPDGTLNELLTTLNEREYDGEPIPLQTCGMATNWPEVEKRTDNTMALYDRCLLRVVVDDIEKELDMVRVLEVIDDVAIYEPDKEAMFSLADLELAQKAVAEVTISKEIRKILASIRTQLRYRMVNGKKKSGIDITSRRLGALQSVLRASAWLGCRDEVTIEDFSMLHFGLWNDRGDHEHVAAVLSTLDAKLCQDLIAKIDTARTEYKNLVAKDYGTSKIEQVTDTIASVVSEVKEVYAKPVFTDGGRSKIDKAMKKLVKDFNAMTELEHKFVEKHGGGFT